MPRFVILEHDWPRPHFDLLLESGEVLKAWRLESPPKSGVEIRAEANFDHRKFYLDFEGELTGNRGRVTRWDFGTYEGEIATGNWSILMNGRKLCGRVSLKDTVEGTIFHFI